MIRHVDFSARGWARVLLWTVLGTLGCIVATFGMDSVNFGAYTSAQLWRALLSDLLLPLTIAPPLLFFLTFKLRELAIAHHKLAISAATDSLTELLNRGAFTTLADAYLNDVRAHERAMGALLVIDIDHFKRVNDSFGHDRGDEALKLVALAIKQTLRGIDLVGRMGGEEFGVFMPGTSMRNAEVAAERIREAVSTVGFAPEGEPVKLTVSVGGASFAGRVPFKSLYKEADRQLYEAKAGGRNRVVFTELAMGPSAIAA